MRIGSSTARQAFSVLMAMAVAASASVVQARADEHDDAFVDALKRHGIVPMGDPAGVVEWAHWACDQLAAGSPKEHIVVWLAQHSPDADNSAFLRTAALYYCPDLKRKAGW
jgi:uncharacterized protein DUF732